MSDAELPSDGGVAEAGPDTGEAVAEATQEAVIDSQPERRYIDVEDPENSYVRFRSNGEDVEVPWSEAVKGFSRGDDYTRKTQALAQERQEAEYALRLQKALEANPEATLRLIAQNYGLTLAEAKAAVEQQEQEPEFADPLERDLWAERKAREALEERLNAMERTRQEREADDQLAKVIGDLQSRHQASNEDIQGVVQYAYEHQLPIDQLPMIYQAMTFQRIQARVQAAETQRQQEAAETARRQAAAVGASQTVANGQGPTDFSLTERVDTGGRMNLRDAIEDAWSQVVR